MAANGDETQSRKKQSGKTFRTRPGQGAGHPAVLLVAVVARPDPKWGEHPCAFVELRPGRQANEADILAFAQTRLARFKLPRTIVFDQLPKTATGKIQKFVLRERAKAL